MKSIIENNNTPSTSTLTPEERLSLYEARLKLWPEVQPAKKIIDSCNGRELKLSEKLKTFSQEQKQLILEYAFIKWPKLEELSISSNGLSSVPDLSKLTALKKLSLSDNELTSLPDFSHLIRLEWIDLSTNKLTSFANGLSNLPNVTILNFAYNKFTSLPDLSKFPTLYAVLADNNPFSFPPERVIEPGYKNGIKPCLEIQSNRLSPLINAALTLSNWSKVSKHFSQLLKGKAYASSTPSMLEMQANDIQEQIIYGTTELSKELIIRASECLKSEQFQQQPSDKKTEYFINTVMPDWQTRVMAEWDKQQNLQKSRQ